MYIYKIYVHEHTVTCTFCSVDTLQLQVFDMSSWKI